MQRWGGGIFRERTGEDQTVLGSNAQHGSRGPISSPTPASSFLPCPTSAEGHPLSCHALLCLAATNFFLLFKHPSFSHRWGFSHTVPSVCHSLPVSTLINFSSFRMGCQVTSFRKPSILTPKRSEHQHWQQTTGTGTVSGQGLHKHCLNIRIKLNEWEKEGLGSHQGWHASDSPGRTVSSPFLKASPISHDLYSMSTQNFSLLIHIHFLYKNRGFLLCHLLKAHGNSFHA